MTTRYLHHTVVTVEVEEASPASSLERLLPICATTKKRIVTTAEAIMQFDNIILRMILKCILETLESQPVHLVTFTCEIPLKVTE